MKTLSIKQPWAWLICAGYKDVENRKWWTNFRGRIYVHAGKGRDKAAIEELVTGTVPHLHEDAEAYIFHMELNNLWDLGAIIGEVDIIDCVTESKSPWFVGKYGFVLANPVLYDKPIPYRGQLGFFEVNLPAKNGG